MRDQLRDCAAARAREERVFVEHPMDDRGRVIIPDVRVFESPRPRAGGVAVLEAPDTVADPIIVHLPPVEITETFIEIIDVAANGRVITVIEFLSLANKKPGDGRQAYLRKQAEVRQAAVNLVEIDLLRGGERTLLAPQDAVAPPNNAPYAACVFRATKPDRVELYEFKLRQRLPAIKLPLRPTDNMCH